MYFLVSLEFVSLEATVNTAYTVFLSKARILIQDEKMEKQGKRYESMMEFE